MPTQLWPRLRRWRGMTDAPDTLRDLRAPAFLDDDEPTLLRSAPPTFPFACTATLESPRVVLPAARRARPGALLAALVLAPGAALACVGLAALAAAILALVSGGVRCG